MDAVLLYCRPKARFHFGKIAPDENSWLNTTDLWIPSDTLFSAIANILADVYPSEVDDLLKNFENGTIRISSGFYFLETAEKRVFLLPKPAHYGLKVTQKFKDFNRILFISQTVWEAGWMFEEWAEKCLYLQGGKVVVAKSDVPEALWPNADKIQLFEESDYPRVKVSTQKRENNYFSLTTISIGDNKALDPNCFSHFYFLMEVANTEWKNSEAYKMIQTAIELLPHQGIGGERSTGCGLMEKVEIVPFSPPSIQKDKYCSVSLVWPKNETELGCIERYQVQTRGGRWLGPSRQLKLVRMINEGAYCTQNIDGGIAHIGYDDPTHYWRYGKAFCLETHPV